MPKLTQEQIECIDDRLYNLGVKFLDIRYEMVDHIASELEVKEGDFKENLKEYFIMNKLQLIKQNKKEKRIAILRAIKLYLKTLATPLAFSLAAIMFLAVYYSSYLVEDGDIIFMGSCIMFTMLIPLIWLARKNSSISVMRPMALMHAVIFNIHQLVIIACYRIDDRAERTLPQRIDISIACALMLVLMISLYRCRKQYVGKYI